MADMSRIGQLPTEGLFEADDLETSYEVVKGEIERVWPYFEERHEVARRNLDYYRGRQWDEADLAAFNQQMRQPYVWNQIEPLVNNLLGIRAMTELTSKAMPVGTDDEDVAKMVTMMTKWSDDLNDIQRVEADIFRDMVLFGAGFTTTYWVNGGIRGGYPITERVPFWQVCWDVGSTKTDLTDARWIARVIPMTRVAAGEVYPEFWDVIENATSASDSHWSIFDSMTEAQGRLYSYDDGIYQSSDRFDLIPIIEHYERKKVRQWIVIDEVSNTSEVFDNPDNAKEYYDGLMKGYLQNGISVTRESDGEELICVAVTTRDVIIQSIVISDQCVYSQETDLPDFPIVASFANYAEGDFWSYVDSLILPQTFLNRMVSEWDNSVGRSTKNLTTVKPTRLYDGWSMETLRRELSKTGAVIPVFEHDAIQAVPNNPASFDFSQLVNLTIGFMTNLAGGRNALGLQENAAESGAAVRQRQDAAGAGKAHLFENLRDWRRREVLLRLWYLRNFTTPGQMIRVKGDDGGGYSMTLGEYELNTLQEIETDITITETFHSATMKELQYQQMKELFLAIGQGLPPEYISSVMIKMNPSLSAKDKEELMAQFDFYIKFQQEKMAQNKKQEMQSKVQDSIERKIMKDQLEKDAGLQ